MTKQLDPNQLLMNAELIHGETAVNRAITLMAAQLNLDYGDYGQDVNKEPPVLLCVMGGAVYFTGQLLPKLQFALELDYVQATRYHGTTDGKLLKWVVMPKENIKNRLVLILDDILDEGITLQAIVEQCRLMGARQVKVAVLVEKLLDKNIPIVANYVGLQVANNYVFGCGMDIYGWWRNLPAIYALKDLD